MKTKLLPCLLITLSSLTAAADHISLWEPKVSLTVGYQDKYLAGRVSKVIIREPNLWSEINLEWENGMYLTWTEYESMESSLSEASVTIGQRWTHGDTTVKLQAALINLHPHDEWFTDDRLAIELFLSRAFKFNAHGSHVLTPELRIGWFSFWDQLDSGVLFAMPTVHHVWNEPFGLHRAALRSRVTVECDGGFYRHNPGAFLQLETSIQFKLNKNCTFTPIGWKSVIPLTDSDDGRNGGDTWYTSFKLDF